MAKQLVAFLLGAALASSWWAPFTVWHPKLPPNGAPGIEFVLTGFITLVTFVIFFRMCVKRWDDK